jgi:hypothetical protein
MLYDSFDDVESVVQPAMPTLKRSLSYVDTTTQPMNPSSTTTWLQQSSSSAAHSDHGNAAKQFRLIVIHTYLIFKFIIINFYRR